MKVKMQNKLKYSSFPSKSITTDLVLRSGVRGLAAKAPRVRELERQKLRRETRLPHNVSSYTWPTALLDAAWSAGGLSVPPIVAKSFLDQFSALRAERNATPKSVQTLLQDFNAKPVLLSILASVLLRDHSQPSLKLPAKQLFVVASQLQDEAASMILFDQALKSGDMSNPDVKFAKQNLHRMVDAGHVAAMSLLARSYELENNLTASLELVEAAAATETNSKGVEDASRGSLAELWELIARLRGKLGDIDGERKALEIAALKFDNPQAYYQLATQYREDFDGKYIEYMLKAAASGIGAAAFEVGKWYFLHAEAMSPSRSTKNALLSATKSEFVAQDIETTTGYKLALEWLRVAMQSKDATNGTIDTDAALLLFLGSLSRQGDFDCCHAFIKEYPKSFLADRMDHLANVHGKDVDARDEQWATVLTQELNRVFYRKHNM